MKLCLLHLSDIHIREASDPILSRAKKIASASFKALRNADLFFVVISGDVAHSGKHDEYKLAKALVDEILRSLREECPGTRIETLVCPGNHDCDFDAADSVREYVIDSLGNKDPEQIAPEIIETCTKVQNHFFAFQQSVSSSVPLGSRLWQSQTYEVHGKKITIDLLNVAWMSQLREKPGTLRFPTARYDYYGQEFQDFRILVMHHPVNWFHQSSYRNFRSLVRRTADLVLTGHEHETGHGEIADAESGFSAYVEGGVLQGEHESTFNIVTVNLDQNPTYECEIYVWKDQLYTARSVPEADRVRAIQIKRAAEFSLSPEFAEYLDDPGANFSHPLKKRLTLPDIFVFPDLRLVSAQGNIEKIRSSEELTEITSLKHGTVITGDERSGKSALLKKLFHSYCEAGFLPLLVFGNSFTRSSAREIDDVLRKAAALQYGEAAVERFEQAPKSKKILLLDDFDEISFPKQFFPEVFKRLTNAFEYMIVASDGLFEIREVLTKEGASPVREFDEYKILEFGLRLRLGLVEKWHSINESASVSDEFEFSKVDNAEKVLTDVLGKNLIPAYPVYLLVLLQSMEAGRHTELQNSAYGHYYQFLITDALFKLNVRVEQLDELLNYCAQLAWRIWGAKGKEIDDVSFRQFHKITATNTRMWTNNSD